MNSTGGTTVTSVKSRNVCRVSIPTVFITLWVSLAFLSNVILNSFSGRLFMVLVILTAVLYVFSKRFFLMKPTVFDLHFLTCWAVILIGYFLLPQPSTLIDITMLISGFVVVRCCSTEPEKYLTSIKIMVFFGMFFAIGVFLNYFLPSLYNLCLGFFPSGFVSAVRSASFSGGQRTSGFTTNPGHAAGFIVIAIIAVFAQLEIFKRNKKKKFLLILLFVALLLTGKRAHLLFIVITIVLCYLLPVRGKEKMKRYWKVFVVLSALCVAVAASWDYLVTIPFFARLEDTFRGLMVGEDVSSARNALSIWAVQLFKENPVIGIGWNVYRTTVIGNATMVTALDTHNIYLQLLCETGIIGFGLFVSLFAVLWIQTKNAYIDCIQSDRGNVFIWGIALKFSFMFQTFFLLYGLTGNPLYDQSWQIIYMFSVAICIGYRYMKKKTPLNG